MGTVCNFLCCKKDRRRGPCNEVRVIEFLLCLVCVSCAVVACFNGHYDTRIHWFFVPLFIVPICYAAITFIDIIVTWAFFPIGWRAWILFSVLGSLLFFLCVGLSPLLTTWYYFLYTIVYVITALVFLMDGLCIVSMIRTLRLGQDPKSPCCNVNCGSNKTTQVMPYTPISNSFAQTDPQCIYKGSSVGDTPRLQPGQPCYGKCIPEKEFTNATNINYVFPAESMMGEPCPQPQTIKKPKSHHRKYKEIDLTPLKNPFSSQSEHN